MIGIILLIILARQIGKRAVDKGRKAPIWWLYTVLVWFGAQFVAAVLASLAFELATGGPPDEWVLMVIGLAASVLGYYLLFRYVDHLPDPFMQDEHLIDQIGQAEDPISPAAGP